MSVQLDKNGRRIEVRSREPLPGMKTTIPGAYLTTGGVWTVPLSVESYRLLRQKFKKRLVLSQELKRWLAGQLENRRYMSKLANSADTKLTVLPRVAPKLHKAMNRRTYQRVGVRFVADGGKALVADDPGLGKTLIALGAILEAEIPGPYLIIAPKTASDAVWGREIRQWLPRDHKVILMPDTRDQRDRRLRLASYGPKTWVVVHPEMVMVQAWWVCQDYRRNRMRCKQATVMTTRQSRQLVCGHVRETRGTKKTEKVIQPSYPKLFTVPWGAIVIDESHESLISRGSKQTQRRRGLNMLRDIMVKRNKGLRIAMSGTPFDSKPHQLWGTLNWLDPQTYSAKHRWIELYWQKGGYTGHDIGEFRKDRERLLWDSLSAIAIRRTKTEVAQDLPPKIHVGTGFDPDDKTSPVGVWLDMDGKQERAYRSMERIAMAELDSGRVVSTTALSELTRLKQLACAYGDVSARLVKKSCYARAKRHRSVTDFICDDCKRQRWHEELEHTYTPQLPSNKFNWTVQALEEWGYPDKPLTRVVIVSFYTGILRMFQRGIEDHFKTTTDSPLCTAITGGTPQNKRRAIIDRFNERGEGPDVMLLNVKAGGTAITLDTADHMIFISETRIPDQQKQAEDRIHRISNPRTCMYYYLRTLNTVDVGTAYANLEADRASHRLLDGRRGVDYVRYVMERSKG